MDIDGLERDLRGAVGVLHQVHGEHDHPRDPEEDDVEAGDQYVGGVEGLEELGLLRPAEGGEGPQAGAEPGVENVFVLAQLGLVAELVLGAHLDLVAADVDVAGLVVPGRDAVAPPELAADAPVLDTAVFHGGDGVFGQRLGADVPLVGQPGLDDGAGAVALRYFQRVVVDLLEQAHGLELGDDGLARGEAVHAGVALRQAGVEVRVDAAVEVEHLGLGQHRGVLVEDVDQRQVVALAHFVVVEVVGRGDLHAAGAEFAVDVLVGDDRDVPADDRQFGELADQLGVALVFRVHRDRGVA